MGLLASNLSILWSIGDNQNLEWEIMVERPLVLNHLFSVRYVRSTSFAIYGFGLLRFQSSLLHEKYICVFWFTSFEFMAPPHLRLITEKLFFL